MMMMRGKILTILSRSSVFHIHDNIIELLQRIVPWELDKSERNKTILLVDGVT